MNSPVFSPGQSDRFRLWDRAPLRLAHRLHLDPLFSADALAELIDRYPPSGYSLVLTSRAEDGQSRWREGDIGNVPGHRVIEAIQAGSLWLNLRDVGRHDRRYADLLAGAYAEIASEVPAFNPSALKLGILISSPRARVHYHADLPGQALWQISGAKRVLVYPAGAPYLQHRALEDIALTGVEFKLPYEAAFDAAATVLELQPGQMLSWPLNSPHRVENHDCLNVSMTSEHWTPQNRRLQKLNLANAVLRRHGWPPRSRALHGPSFWAKAALQAAWRRSRWGTGIQRMARPIDFRLAADAPGGWVDVAPHHR